MSDDELKGFLATERAAGVYAGSGSFGVDFRSAMAKRAHFTLPRPGLWAVRVVQAMVRLGARSVSIQQGRHELVMSAPLRSDPDPSTPLGDLFLEQAADDPRSPLQGGLLAALGRDYTLELHWSQDGRRKVMALSEGRSSISSGSLPVDEPLLELRVRPPEKAGLFARFFSVADFSAEFQELNRACFLSPIPMFLDNRPLDLLTGFPAHFYPALEFRGVRATSGPRLRLRPEMSFELERHAIANNSYFQPMLGGNYAFLLSVGWSVKPQTSKVAWVRDGVLVDEEPLFSTPSPLELTLFLPADGLASDITGLALLQSKERQARVREARLWAATSLKTRMPPTPLHITGRTSDEGPEAWLEVASEEQRHKALWIEVDSRMSEALEACAYTVPDKRRFRDAIDEHLEASASEASEPSNLSGHGAYLVQARSSEEDEQARESLNRWGSFLSYVPPPEDEPIHLRYKTPGPAEPLRVKQFFGDMYVELRRPDKRS